MGSALVESVSHRAQASGALSANAVALTQKSDRLCQWKSSSRARRGFVSGMSPSADGAVEPQRLNVA